MDSVLFTVRQWTVEHGVRIVFILGGAGLLIQILKMVVHRFEKKLEAGGAVTEKGKRIKTLSGIIKTTAEVSIYAAASIMVISECGIAIGPLLAGAGIAGVAVGFGAQSLVKDVISGFFIILENQIRVGDVVTVAGAGGIVEAINLRTTRLRDLEGRVHIIPNGLIEVATNFTCEWSRALVEIGVAYKEDVDQVMAVLKEVGAELCDDPDFKDLILEPMTMLGVDSFGDSSVNIRIFFKTVPIRQWDIAREFRKRVKKVFDARGIEIPFPHRTVYMGEADNKGHLRISGRIESERT